MRSWTLTRVLKSLTGFAIFLTIAVIIVLFIQRTGQKTEIRSFSPAEKKDKVAASQDIRHLEVTRGERGNFEIKADNHFLGEDERYHLEGHVKIISYREKGLEITADRADYDQEMIRFKFSGQVVLKQDDLSIVSADVVYDTRKEIFSTESGVIFEAERLTGSSNNLSYDVAGKRLLLEKDVEMTILPAIEDTLPIQVKSESFEYISGIKTGIFTGGVFLERDRDSAQADVFEFKLVKSEERIRDVTFRGNVKVVSRSSPDTAEWESSYFRLPAEQVEIEADELNLWGFPDSSVIHQVLASGGSRFVFRGKDGASTEILGEDIRFFFLRTGGLREFSAVKEASLREKDGSGVEVRSLQGDRLLLKGPQSLLSADGSHLNQARYFSKDQEITANSIQIDLEKSDLEAKEEFKMVISGEGESSSGMFEKGRPIFITAGEMRYSDKNHRFIFKQDIKVWQDRQQLFGEEFTMNTETQEIHCSGTAKSIFVVKSADSPEDRRIGISADEMFYNPAENTLLFTGTGSLTVQNIDVKAPSISIAFKEEGGIGILTASGGVTFKSDQHEGTSSNAVYDLENETITFTGNPVIKDKEKGSLQGDKLTFYLADDRIVVENLGRRRSVTVIKS